MDGVINWLFVTREGVFALIGIGIVVFFFVAFILEKRTKKLYYNHEKVEGEGIFDKTAEGSSVDGDDIPAANTAANSGAQSGEDSLGGIISDLRKELDEWDPNADEE